MITKAQKSILNTIVNDREKAFDNVKKNRDHGMLLKGGVGNDEV